MKKFASLIMGLILVFSVSATALAGKITGEVTVNQTNLHYQDMIDFTVVTNAPVSMVTFNCYQNGVLVLAGGGIAHTETNYITESNNLESGAYTGGPANCTATLRYYRSGHFRVIDTTDFNIVA